MRTTLLMCLALTTRAAAAEPDAAAIKELLAKPILAPGTPDAEVRAYADARTVRMPTVTDAAAWEKEAGRLRHEVLDRVVFRGVPVAWRNVPANVVWGDAMPGGPGYSIRKLRYEALPGLWIPALLYVPDHVQGRVPAMLNVNGHDANGKAAKYKQIRCINMAKRGMLALNLEWLGMGQLKTKGFEHRRMNQLDLCGTSGLAVFYLAMQRGLDVLVAHENADPERVGVAGLSGGGWQTIMLSALDTRVTLANPVAGYSSLRTRLEKMSDLGDSEQTPVDMATIADYDHLTAMRAPRATLLTYNAKDDCCFAADHALPPLLDAARPIYQLFGAESRLRWHVNHDPGNHNFERDNREALYRMIGAEFFASASGTAGAAFNATEIPSDDEVKSSEELNVELPAENADFHSLAVAVAESLPRDAELPADRAAATEWQRVGRARLVEVTRLPRLDVTAEKVARHEASDVKATGWRLRCGDGWTIPAVEITPAEPRGTAIVLADKGRVEAGETVSRLLGQGLRVVAVDPFYFGESKMHDRDWLCALLVSTVGGRPLGIESGQVAAVARWQAKEHAGEPVTLVATGPRTSTIALVAAAAEDRAIQSVELNEPLGSLKEVVRGDMIVDAAPELFCFGLLEQFDVPQLVALVAPRKASFRGIDDAARTALAPAKRAYAAWRIEHDPLR